MKIEKSLLTGEYMAGGSICGHMIIGYGISHVEALANAFINSNLFLSNKLNDHE